QGVLLSGINWNMAGGGGYRPPRPHLWTPRTRLGMSARLEHSFLTRTVSRESVRNLAADGSAPVNSCLAPAGGGGGAPPAALSGTSDTSLRQLHRDNEIAEIAADSMRISGALRHFKHLRRATTTSTHSIPSACNKGSLESAGNDCRDQSQCCKGSEKLL